MSSHMRVPSAYMAYLLNGILFDVLSGRQSLECVEQSAWILCSVSTEGLGKQASPTSCSKCRSFGCSGLRSNQPATRKIVSLPGSTKAKMARTTDSLLAHPEYSDFILNRRVTRYALRRPTCHYLSTLSYRTIHCKRRAWICLLVLVTTKGLCYTQLSTWYTSSVVVNSEGRKR
jgi:hypothetical protein